MLDGKRIFGHAIYMTEILTAPLVGGTIQVHTTGTKPASTNI